MFNLCYFEMSIECFQKKYLSSELSDFERALGFEVVDFVECRVFDHIAKRAHQLPVCECRFIVDLLFLTFFNVVVLRPRHANEAD